MRGIRLKNKFVILIPVLFLFTSTAFGEGFDAINPVNPLSAQPVENNMIALTVKKATLTHNSIHNQYVFAFNRFMQSNVKPAYNDFKILIETIGSNDYAYMKLAESMADIGFFRLSELAISKIEDNELSDLLTNDIKLYYYPSKKLKVDDEIYLGEIFSNIIYNDQSKEATQELVKNSKLIENYDYANYIAALGYLKSNEFIEADKYIDDAIKMNPRNLNYKKLKAEILSQGKKPQNAIKMINSIKSQKLYTSVFERKINSLEHYVLYKSKKNYSEKMYHLGYYYYFENEFAKSIRTLQGALSNKKKLNKDIYALLSRIYFVTEDFDKSKDTAQKALNLDGKNTIALLVSGDLAYRAGDFKTALKYYKNAENTDKSDIPSIRAAEAYEKLNKDKKAQEIYEKIIKTHNNCYLAYYKIALKNKAKEIEYIKKSVAINMNFKDAWIDLGRIAIEKAELNDAKKYLRIANYIDENDFRYYYYQGLLAKKQGSDGTEYFKKSLSINPDYQPAKEELNI